MIKVPVYPNQQFKDLDEYYAFCMDHTVFGGEALKLKTKMDRQQAELLPKIYPKGKR